jgi:hypothetical protein
MGPTLRSRALFGIAGRVKFAPILWRRRDGLAAAGTALLSLVALSLVVRGHTYGRVILWSGLMIASMIGWGSLVNLWLARDRWVDWGLRAGWGMAAMLGVGGYLALVHLAFRPVLIGQVVFGLVAWLATMVMRRGPQNSVRRSLVVLGGNAGVVTLVASAYVFAVCLFLAGMGDRWFEQSDDPSLYWALATKLAQTGSLFEPFNARRISTFGGQVYLDASFLSVAPVHYLNAFDPGLCLIVVVGLLVGHVGRSGLKRWHAVPLGLAFLLLFSLGEVRRNCASVVSTLVGFITLYRTLRCPAPESSPPDVPAGAWPIEPRRAALLGALTVVCILLRTSNAAGVLPFIVLALVFDFLLATRQPWSRQGLTSLASVASTCLVAFVVVLLPWSIQLHQSCGTYFYPFGHSNITPGWTFLKKAEHLDDTVRTFVTHLTYDGQAAALLPFAVVGLMPLNGRARTDLVALTIGALIGLWALCREATAFFPEDIARYSYPYAATVALLGAVSAERTGGRAALAAAALGMHMTVHREQWHKALLERVHQAFDEWTDGQKEYDEFEAPTGDYRDVQTHIPPGKTFVTAVFQGFRFDFARNRIFALDLLGGMGPKPGWPAYRGPQALGDYLRANGVDYLVYVDFNLPSELYNRTHWQSHLSKTESYLFGEARLQLDAEDAIEKLSAERRVVYSAHGMTVVDLAP